MKSLKRTGGVILFVVLLAFTFFGCDNLSEPVDISEILGTLELDGEFIDFHGSYFRVSSNSTITIKGSKYNNGEVVETEHTGKLYVQGNKIVSDTITTTYASADNQDRTATSKFEITLNPKDPTTLLVKETYINEYVNNSFESIYTKLETEEVNFNGIWTFGENRLVILDDKFAIIDDSQILYSGVSSTSFNRKNTVIFMQHLSDESVMYSGIFSKASNKIHMNKSVVNSVENEYLILTKLSDSIDVDFAGENPFVGKYKDFDGRTIEITDSSVTLNGEIFIWIDDETNYRVKNPSIDYTFSFMDFNSDWIDLGEKETTFEKIKWNSENGEYDVIGTETYLKGYTLHIDGDRVSFYVDFGDEGHGYGVGCVKYKAGPVDFTGTWILTEKLYNDERYETAEITINSDGSYSLLVDGKEMNTENHLIDLEDANNENGCPAYDFIGVITESGKLYAEFCYKYDAESDHSWWTTAFFTKQ